MPDSPSTPPVDVGLVPDNDVTISGSGGNERFHIGNFISRISATGLARSNRFKVLIPAPSFDGGNTSDYRQISLNCESAELPGRDLTVNESRIYGPNFKMPYMTNYNDVSFTFLCDAGLTEKRVFDDWISFINPKDSFDFEYRDSYTSTVTIAQLTDNELTAYSCDLIEAYPIMVNAIPVSWGDDNYHRVTVTMTYRYWIEKGKRGEETAKIDNNRQTSIDVRRARENQKRMRNAQETVLRNRYGPRGIKGIATSPEPIKVPEPKMSSSGAIDITPPSFRITG